MGCVFSEESIHGTSTGDSGMHKKYIAILKQLTILENFADDELLVIAKHLELRKFNAGELLMEEGGSGSEFFIIESGDCEVMTHESGVIATLHPGDYCGEQALLSRGQRNASVKAIGEVHTLVLDHESFNKLLKDEKRIHFKKRDNQRQAVMGAPEEPIIPMNRASMIKTVETRTWIQEAVKTNLLFADMPPDDTAKIVDRMHCERVKKGQDIIVQGDLGNKFYVIDTGEFAVIVDGKEVARLGSRKCFGELALLYNAPRNATIRCIEDSKVWVVERAVFRGMVREMYVEADDQRIERLQQIEVFSSMDRSQLELICDVAHTGEYKAGVDIVKEGEKGDRFYVIMSGEAEWVRVAKDKGLITEGYFGELALMSKSLTRYATVRTLTPCRTLELDQKDFVELMGPLGSVLKKRAKSYLLRKNHVQPHSARRVPSVKNVEDFKTHGILGQGAFGYVTLVSDPTDDYVYALKAIRKHKLVERHQENIILREKKVMLMLNHRRLVTLHRTYKDECRVYFLLDACLGGELFTLLRRCKYFKEKVARFYSACVVEGFEYMHAQDVIFRDLKPENLILDVNGYLKIADFGFAKIVREKTFTLCGTPDYISPEILTGRGHGKGTDWWTLGIFIFEMLASITPFYSIEPLEMYRKIVKKKYKTPKFFSADAADIVSSLLCRRAARRLGVIDGGVHRVKTHPWFREFDWEIMRNNRYKAPYYPHVRSKFDLSNFKQVRDKGGKLQKATLKVEDEF